MNDTTRTRTTFPVLVALALVTLFVLSGCRGDQGPAGQDGSAFDTSPPTITLNSPEFGDTLVDTLVAQAYAIDNVEIDEVTFFLDGTSKVNDSTWSTLASSPYEWTFALGAMGIGPGAHTIMARAYDVERNWAETPTVIFYLDRIAPPGAGVLSLGKFSDLSLYTTPLRDEFDSTAVLDSLLFARFTADRLLRIDSVRFWVDTLANDVVTYDRPIRVSLFTSNGVYPDSLLASALVDSLTLAGGYPGWRSIDFRDDLIQLNAGKRFHVTLSADAPSDTTKMVLGCVQVDPYAYETANRSGFLLLGENPEFVTFQQYTPNAFTVPELLIEVYVQRLP